jgi:polycystin 1L2
MWFSVATRPARSRFTRVQRLTCCLLICCMSILFNLLGYIVKNANDVTSMHSASNPDPVLFRVGSVQITTWTLTVSVISSAATIPITLLVILLFRERGVRFHELAIQTLYSKYRIDDDDDESSDNFMRTGYTDGRLTKSPVRDDEFEDDDASCLERCLLGLSRCLTAIMSKIFPLPWFTHIIAYVLTLAIVVTCFLCTNVLAYSNLPQTWQQDAWLQSIVLSLFEDIFIIQPAQIILIVMLFACIIRTPLSDDEQLAQEIALSAAAQVSIAHLFIHTFMCNNLRIHNFR